MCCLLTRVCCHVPLHFLCLLANARLKIHVTDDDPFSLTRGGALEDLSLVTKYRRSEEDYDKRKGTLRWVSVTALTPPPAYCFFFSQWTEYPAYCLLFLFIHGGTYSTPPTGCCHATVQ